MEAGCEGQVLANFVEKVAFRFGSKVAQRAGARISSRWFQRLLNWEELC